MKRIINGWTADGTPRVLFEGEDPHHFDFGETSSDEIWATDSVPAEYRLSTNPTDRAFRVEPAIGGSVCRIATYRPGAEIPLHTTETVDYAVVVSGQLTMTLSDREILLDPGDVVVQLAAPHGWANRGDVECVVFVILLTAEGASEEGQIAWP